MISKQHSYTRRLSGRILTASISLLFFWLTACASERAPEPTPPAGEPPVASFFHERTLEGTELRFDASPTFDPDGEIVSYRWDFGDGDRGSGVRVTHVYPSAGSYDVELTVTDGEGQTSRTTDTVTLSTISGTLSARSETTTLAPKRPATVSEEPLGVPVERVPSSIAAPSVAGSPVAGDSLASATPHADFVPGEIIVKFSRNAQAEPGLRPSSLSVAGRTVMRARTLALERTDLYRAAGATRVETLQMVAALNARRDVEYAQPNYILERSLQPADELYPLLWNYPEIGLEAAWDITTGSESVVVAVIDSGMLMTHPDRPSNLLSGYDFVTDPSNSDGDARDSDPTDPGPFTSTAYHGSHVAGTIAAAANNDYRGGPGADGIVGVSWQANILPVRALDEIGTMEDIIDGLLWAIGDSVPGVPDNIAPARVVNMSLGGAFPCSESPAYQDAIDRANAAGAVVVVAAGNDGADASGYSPASCDGVIATGASTLADERAEYSNWGSAIDVMAPGGDVSTDLDGDGQPDGVLSLWKDDTTGDFGFIYQVGTSMAAPHVSGVVALMLSVEPELDPADVLNILSSTAVPYTAGRCDADDLDVTLSASDCGAGRIDASAALQMAQSFDPTPPPPEPEPEPEPGALVFSPSRVAFGTSSNSASVTLANSGSTTLDWQLVGFTEDPANPSLLGDDVFMADPGSGSLTGGAETTLIVDLNRAAVQREGAYEVFFQFDTDGDPLTNEASLPITFVIEPGIEAVLTGPMTVWAFLENSDTLSGRQTSSGVIVTFEFAVGPGSHIVLAWSDENENNEIDSGDFYGSFPNDVLIQQGDAATGVDLTLDLVQDAFDVELSLPAGITLEALETAQ